MIRKPFTSLLAKAVMLGCISLALAGCGTFGGLTGEEKLAVLKGASEHIQGCTRTYTLNSGFPPTSGVTIICMPVTASPLQPLTAEQVAAISAAAAQKALEDFTAPRN